MLDLIDFGVARVLPNNKEVCLATDTASDTPTVSFDVILSLATVQGVQRASDDKGFAFQAVGMTQRLVLQQIQALIACESPS